MNGKFHIYQSISTGAYQIKYSDAYSMILPYKFLLILGHDVAGVTTHVGKNVTKCKVGDPVYAAPRMAASVCSLTI